MVDVDALPPVQTLILEVLASRYRLGEQTWSFPSRLGPQGRKLAQAGLVYWGGHSEPRTSRAWLTDEGKAAVLYGDYTVPDPVRQRDEAQATLARVADLAMRWDDMHGRELLRVLTEKEMET